MSKSAYYRRRTDPMANFNRGEVNWRQLRTGKAEEWKPDHLVPASILKKLRQTVTGYTRKSKVEVFSLPVPGVKSRTRHGYLKGRT